MEHTCDDRSSTSVFLLNRPPPNDKATWASSSSSYQPSFLEEEGDGIDTAQASASFWAVISKATHVKERGEEEGDQQQQQQECFIHPLTPNYYDWSSIFPQLQVLRDNIDTLREEVASISGNWVPWPEEHYSSDASSADWTVFPFLHTFPAYDPEKSVWLGSTCGLCSRTASLLRGVDGIRTALFSKLGGGTVLSSHTGWSDLANYVLRCHINLSIPGERGACGLVVDGEVAFHEQGEILVFDDSKSHNAFNNSSDERIVLIVDLLRPPHVPLGRAVGGHTDQLDAFISRFR